MNDLRFAVRQVRKNPGFATVTILTLALGIGATSTVFSLIQGVLLTPPPYANPERLVLIQATRQDGQRSRAAGLRCNGRNGRSNPGLWKASPATDGRLIIWFRMRAANRSRECALRSIISKCLGFGLRWDGLLKR